MTVDPGRYPDRGAEPGDGDDILEAAIGAFMDAFRSGNARSDGPSSVFSYLSDDELSRALAAQEDFLRHLVDPLIPAEELDAIAAHVGYVHAMVGVKSSWLLEIIPLISEVFHKSALAANLVGAGADHWIRVLSRRLGVAMRIMVAEGERIDEVVADGVEEVNRAVSVATTGADLIRAVLAAIYAIDGVASVAYGRADERGVILYEYVQGDEFSRYLELLERHEAKSIIANADVAQGLGPSGRAWRSGQIQHSASFSQDPSMEPWREMAAGLGLRSVMVLPIVKSDGETVGLLNIYSKWPGYFASPMRYRAFAYIQQVTSAALVKLDSGKVVSYEKRSQYRGMLRGDALEMHYQPIVDLHTGNVVKLEALARLRGNDGTLISPGEFMGALGSEDLYVLFARGLEKSMRAVSRLDDAGITTGVSVNLPPQAVKDRRYFEAIVEKLSAWNVAPERLTLELTEEEELSDVTFNEASLLWRIRSLGVLLAQDDLGAGYSSLLRLERFGFHEVKIDQELVRGAGDPRNALDLIQHLTRLSHDMGIEVVVEGLESASLIEAAAIMGADYGQGYGIAKPMPEESVIKFFADFKWNANIGSPVTPLGALAALRRWSHQVTALGSYSELIESSLPIEELKSHLKGFPQLDLDTYFAEHASRGVSDRVQAVVDLENRISAFLAAELALGGENKEPALGQILDSGRLDAFEDGDALISEIHFTGAQLREILALQNRILTSISQGVDSKAILDQVCLGAESMLANAVATVMRLDDDGVLRIAAGPSLSASAYEAFGALVPSAGAGSCANAVLSCEAVYVTNTQVDPRWRDIKALANQFNLRACWSLPVKDPNSKILGSFALSSFENRKPSKFQRTLLETCANLVGIILERQRITAELELDRGRLRHMFDGNQAVKFVIDADTGIITEMNSAGAIFYGYEHDDLEPISIFDINVDMTPAELARIARISQLNGSYKGRARHRVASGELRDVEFFTHLYSEGDRHYFVSVIQDITDQLATERELELERKLAEGVLGSLSGMVVVLDQNGKIVRFNREAEEITGYTFDEVRENPKLWMNWIDLADMESVKKVFTAILSGQSMGTREFWHTSKSGERRFVAMSDAYVLDDEGNIAATILLGNDVTEKHHNEELVRSERDFTSSVMDAVSDVIMVLDRSSRVVRCNAALETVLGVPCDDIRFKPTRLADLLVFDDDEAITEWFANAMQGDILEFSGFKRAEQTRTTRIFEWKAVPLATREAVPEFFVVTGTDVTARREEARQLKRAAVVFETSPQAIIITNGKGAALDVNPAYCSATGFSRQEALKTDLTKMVSRTNSAEILEELYRSVAKTGRWSGTLWTQRKSGEIFPAYVHVNSLQVEGREEPNILTMFSDISDIVRQQDELADLAYHDALTKLPNRSLLAEKIADAMAGVRRRGGMLGVAYLDLDNFKPVNDTFGHSGGDRFLVGMASRITEALREVDSVARMGGDEFVCLLSDLESVADSDAVLARLNEAIRLPVELGTPGRTVSVTASIGVVYYCGGEADPDALLRRADHLMYEAKRAGGNRCIQEEM